MNVFLCCKLLTPQKLDSFSLRDSQCVIICVSIVSYLSFQAARGEPNPLPVFLTRPSTRTLCSSVSLLLMVELRKAVPAWQTVWVVPFLLHFFFCMCYLFTRHPLLRYVSSLCYFGSGFALISFCINEVWSSSLIVFSHHGLFGFSFKCCLTSSYSNTVLLAHNINV